MDAGSQAGLFLDLDGTLADSLAVMRTVYDRFLEQFGEFGCGRGVGFDKIPHKPGMGLWK